MSLNAVTCYHASAPRSTPTEVTVQATQEPTGRERRKRIFAAFTVLSLLLVAGGVVGLAPPAATVESADARIDELFAELDRPDAPGAAVLVVYEGEVVYRKGFGQADLERATPISPSTVFDIASVSKQFAGMAVAMLIEEGRVDPAADLRIYLPELPDFGPTVTVDHLIHHTSGIRDWPGTLAVAGWRMDDVISFDQILTMARNQRDLNFAPGAEYSYSNTGYNVLAELVSRVAGMSFRAWTEAHLFGPLGMRDTHFHDDHTEVVRRRALGYARANDGFANVANGLTALGSSSLYTTVDDLAKWILNFETARVGGPRVVERMRRRGVLNDGDTIAYAFGQSAGRYRGAATWSHTGSWAGFRTVLVRVPEHRFGVVILSNSAEYDPTSRAYRVADVVLEDVLGPRAAAPDATDPNGGSGAQGAVDVPFRLLAEYAGTYRLGPGWLVTITHGDEGLTAQATNEASFPMTAVSQSEFFVEAYGASMTFGRADGGGAVNHLLYRDIRAPRVEPITRPLDRLDEYEGEFYSEELDTTYRMSVRDGVLVAHHRRHGDVELTPVLRDEFLGSQWFIPSLEFDRGDRGEVTGFRITQGRSRNLRFELRGRAR